MDVVQPKDLTQTVKYGPFHPISNWYDLRSTYLDVEVLHQMDDIQQILVNLPQFVFKEYGGLMSLAD